MVGAGGRTRFEWVGARSLHHIPGTREFQQRFNRGARIGCRAALISHATDTKPIPSVREKTKPIGPSMGQPSRGHHPTRRTYLVR